MKVTKFQPQGFDAVLRGLLSNDTTAVSSNTYAINGITVEGAAGSNYHIVAYSSNFARWIPHDASGGSVSYGSNAMAVNDVNAGGSSTDVSRMDHRHQGIATITASSSNTMQRPIVNLRPGSNVTFGLTSTDGDAALDTITINSTATGGGGGGAATVGPLEEFSLLKPYTFDKSPNGTFADKNYALNGASQAGLLTQPGMFEAVPNASTGFTAGRSIGWRRGSELTGGTADTLLIDDIDLGSARDIYLAHLYGWYNSANQVVHPNEVEVYYSSDGSSYTSWASVTGMGVDPGTLSPAPWFIELSATNISRRYWRFRVKGGNAGSGDDWLFIVRLRLFGVR